MDIEKLLKSDYLDIIFHGKNKEYGAYQLRKSYNKHFFIAMGGMISLVLLIFIGSVVAGFHKNSKKQTFVVEDVQLEEIKEAKVDPPPPPKPRIDPPKIQIIKFTPPKIVKNDEVKKEDKPPEQNQIDSVKIGPINQQGTKDDGIAGPPVNDNGKGVIEAPKASGDGENYDKLFTKVEIEASFPGGGPAWARFLNRNLHYPDGAIAANIQGTVVVQFIVDKDGSVSEIKALEGPEEGGLREEAIRVIKKSGKWTPAIQNGRQVKCYKKQPISFKLETEGQ